MDVVFDKTVSRNEIEKYEKGCLEKVSNFSLMAVLKRMNWTEEAGISK